MKFTEHLIAHITPEWRKQYVNYEEMKQMLYAAVETAPSAELVEPEVLTRYFAKFDERFFHYCDKELAKINTFFSEKLAEATRRYASLKSELSEAIESEYQGKKKEGQRKMMLGRVDLPVRKQQDLKLAFSEFYLSLILLQNYQNLNFTGFRKILKKHDKLLNVDYGARWHNEHVVTSHFHTNKDISRLIAETESTVTNDLEGGDRQRAMKRLRVPPLGEKQSPWTTFKVGLFSGSFIVLICVVILSGLFHPDTKGDWRVSIRLFRCPLLLVEFIFLMGVNVYGWRSSGVNHVLIFELDPRNHLSEQHIMEVAAIFGVIWTLSVLSFIYAEALGIPAFVNPLVLMGIMVAFLLNPTKTFRHEARFWVLRVLGRIFASPFFYVGFADFWLADQLTSLVPALVDLGFFACFYIKLDDWYRVGETSGSVCISKYHHIRLVIACLPSWFRFAQCLRRYRDTKEKFPHLANAVKYATSFFVIIFSHLYLLTSHQTESIGIAANPYFYLWIFASMVSTSYSYTWDIKMDWGLFDKKCGDNKFLREEVVYSSNWYYYFAIIEDLILRFGWVLSMSLTEMGYIHSELMVAILAPLEVFRRFVWNFFRLENEHLNNCGKFRAVRDISVAPMDTSDQAVILRMMDSAEGVFNRHKKKGKNKDTKLLLEADESNDEKRNSKRGIFRKNK
ncbi:xenotropic and polytropic retrovirus receptor 1 homolog isoform X2 [Cimex lectularius]|uniref:Xenotropic and polytropic retrovirus receptor 1 n=1 Tax=Cimex lectularius TaxID=79782 RepID=A0A8I6SLV3_CIMLE|nr:xenotropic and polytropic retrovirus receptor 1 homolog isoform X2 [Cimex lectularius]